MERRVDVAPPQVRAEQLVTAEDVKRKEAVVVVVPMKELALLVAMHAIVGGVEVEDEFLGRAFE